MYLDFMPSLMDSFRNRRADVLSDTICKEVILFSFACLSPMIMASSSRISVDVE